MARPISAADLRLSAEPSRFARAMLLCQGSHVCGEKGFCHREGECFRSKAPPITSDRHELELLRQEFDDLRGQLLDLQAELKELRQEIAIQKRRRTKKRPPKIMEVGECESL